MKVLRFSLIAILLSAAAYCAAWRWGVRAVILTDWSGPLSSVSIIRSRHPVCVVNPRWIQADEQELQIRWAMAETQGRLALVFLIWCGAMIVNFQYQNRAAIKTFQGTLASSRP